MTAFAWPLATLIFGVIFVLLFKPQIGRFLDRTKSVGKGGFHAYDTEQSTTKPDPLTQFLETYQSPMLLEIESAIDADIKRRGLTNLADANRALCKNLAGTVMLLQFEKTKNAIWASQVAALIFLNGRAGASTRETELEVYFDTAAVMYPRMYEGRAFQDWLGFLTAQSLVLETKDGVAITVRGREFLKWRMEDGRSGPPYG